ncbi:hypothetical protein H2LOC_011735 [Methylocystis heyeri]|uniref:Uncharacterized protein n=2 Tax=Methylocystis heyeri TaxID=391905 RepID=A0A6B8KLF3_9HYPH|nr:hypothetical protein H2LOC_011735 [Methylocystis heyeri]
MNGGGWRSFGARLFALALFYAAALVIGAALFVALMRSGLVSFSHILFYDGIYALAAGFLPLVFCLNRLKRIRAFGALSQMEEVSAALVSSSLLCAFFVLGPVTVDRSISIFMLSRFAAAEQGLTEREARDLFVSRYVDGWSQISRRLSEQERSGNLAHKGERWEITPQGRGVMKTSQGLAAIFATDPRFVGKE